MGMRMHPADKTKRSPAIAYVEGCMCGLRCVEGCVHEDIGNVARNIRPNVSGKEEARFCK